MEHILKVKKREFEALLNGELTFVIYKVDRIYTTGDRLILFELDNGKETGRSLTVRITFICHAEDDVEGIKDDYCVVSVKRSGKNTRTNSGNKPGTFEEVVEYAATLGKSQECAKRFFDYYSMSGWKMKNGIPLADWKAALRNWKDFGSAASKVSEEEKQQVALLLPLLLQELGKLCDKREEIQFKDPHVGTVVQFFGIDRIKETFSTYDIRVMVEHYFSSRSLGTGIPTIRTDSRYGKGCTTVPTLQEYAEILKKRREKASQNPVKTPQKPS